MMPKVGHIVFAKAKCYFLLMVTFNQITHRQTKSTVYAKTSVNSPGEDLQHEILSISYMQTVLNHIHIDSQI